MRIAIAIALGSSLVSPAAAQPYMMPDQFYYPGGGRSWYWEGGRHYYPGEYRYWTPYYRNPYPQAPPLPDRPGFYRYDHGPYMPPRFIPRCC